MSTLDHLTRLIDAVEVELVQVYQSDGETMERGVRVGELQRKLHGLRARRYRVIADQHEPATSEHESAERYALAESRQASEWDKRIAVCSDSVYEDQYSTLLDRSEQRGHDAQEIRTLAIRR